jgi:hypothetical protein
VQEKKREPDRWGPPVGAKRYANERLLPPDTGRSTGKLGEEGATGSHQMGSSETARWPGGGGASPPSAPTSGGAAGGQVRRGQRLAREVLGDDGDVQRKGEAER